MAKQALDGRRLNAFSMDPMKLVVIGIDTNDTAEHPLWDERIHLPLDEGMVVNISSIGIKEPIIVRKTATAVEVVDGRRRVLHAREANKRLAERGEPLIEVPAMLAKGSEGLMEVYAIALNEIRAQDSLLVKVAKSERMLARNGGDVSAVAVAFGVSGQTIRVWQQIAALPSKLRKVVDEGKVAPTLAIQLAKLPKEELNAVIEKANTPQPGKAKRLTEKKLKPKDTRSLRERLLAASGAGKSLRLSHEDISQIVGWMPAK